MDQKREKLMEDYEDALFAIVMDQIAEEEGKHLAEEAQRLEGEDFQVPEGLDRKCIDAIRRAEKKQRKEQSRIRRRISIRRICKVALVAVLTMILAVSIAYAAIPEFRAGVLNLMLKVTEIATEITMTGSSSGTASDTSEFDFQLTYLPKGFFLSDTSTITSDCTDICYIDEDNNNFDFGYAHMVEGNSVDVDTENAKVQYTTLRGCEGMIIQKSDPIENRECVALMWFDPELRCRFFVAGYGLPYSEVEKIYNSLIITRL